MKLLSWGANSHGQLGQGNVSEACVIPTEILDLPFDPADVRIIVGGGGHTLLLTRNGQVFATGWNIAKQLGIQLCETDRISSFSCVDSLSCYNITYLACSWDSSLAVSRDGAVLVWGSNSFSQLGVSKEIVSRITKPLLLPITAPRHAAFGLRHLVIVDSNGNVLVSGCGSKGQLGLVALDGQPIREVNTLTIVPGVEGVVRVACGQHHTIVLTASGQVVIWGDNKFGQLGLDPTLHPMMPTPNHLFQISDIGDVYAGWSFTLLISDGGVLSAWGRNNYGQLGVHSNVSYHPMQLKSLQRVKQLAVGSEHCVAMIEMGHLMSWGWNEHGNCGNGSVENVMEPSPVALQNGKAVLVGGGGCHNFAVVDV